MRADWLGGVLHDAGLRIVEHDGWRQRGHGDFTDLRAVVWHHDASPVGPSPGVPGFMLRNWETASANCWVALDGTWHLLAAGVAYHAGRVLPGKPGNKQSIGVETDHTTGEAWSGVFLLDSLRRGTAAILAHLDEDDDGLEFHKTICLPPGRKTDPDGLSLTEERRAVCLLLHPTQHPQEDPDVALGLNDDDDRRASIRRDCWQFWGRAPSAAEQQALLVTFKTKGSDPALAAITDHGNAKAFRKKTG